MKWVLEFRRDGVWEIFTRGTLEECLVDALALAAGAYSIYDAARLGFEKLP